jgi:hypothetical protein
MLLYSLIKFGLFDKSKRVDRNTYSFLLACIVYFTLHYYCYSSRGSANPLIAKYRKYIHAVILADIAAVTLMTDFISKEEEKSEETPQQEQGKSTHPSLVTQPSQSQPQPNGTDQPQAPRPQSQPQPQIQIPNIEIPVYVSPRKNGAPVQIPVYVSPRVK